jgi:putative ABC transport system permease protein
VRAVPGVDVAAGDLTTGDTRIISAAGKVVGGGPYFGVGFDSLAAGSQRLTPFRLQRGRFATGPGEVVIDAGTASTQHLHLGESVRIEAHGPVHAFTVTGIATFGSVKSIGKATFAVFDLREAQRLFGETGRFDSILVAARPGAAPAVRHALAAAVGPSARVKTAAAQDRFDLAGLKQFVSIIEIVLLAFAGVAMFVGAFTIANTLSITVAQRSRELALLRTIGASQHQMRRSVLAEAALIGSATSLVGLFAGLGLGKGLSAVLASAGIDLPQAGTVFALHTIAISLITGVGVTTLASLSAARRATRVAPVLALRDAGEVAPVGTARVSRRAALLTAGGLGGLIAGLFVHSMTAGARALVIVSGALALFWGIALLAPVIVPVLVRTIGAITSRMGGTAGRLARGNAVRNPRRTAGSASPLMIGVTLVVLLAVIASGMRDAAQGSIRKSIRADYVVASTDGYSPVPASAGAVAAVPGSTASAVAQSDVQVFGRRVTVNGVDPDTIAGAFGFDYAAGSDATLRSLGGHGAVVDSTFASKNHLRVGSRFTATTVTGRRLALDVRAIDRPIRLGALGLGAITIASGPFRDAFPGAEDRLVFVQLAGGQSAEQLLAQRFASYPDVQVFTAAGFAAKQVEWLGAVLAVFYVLLALAVMISLFGIVNTLVLSTFERTRELGTLRALGMSRRQVRRMVRHESVITSLIGVITGVGVGLGLAALVTGALHHDGLRFAVPIGSIVAFLVIAVVAGVAAAVAPARRASRMAPLAALAYE